MTTLRSLFSGLSESERLELAARRAYKKAAVARNPHAQRVLFDRALELDRRAWDEWRAKGGSYLS